MDIHQTLIILLFLATAASCNTEREKYSTRICEVLGKATDMSPKEVQLSHQFMPLIPAKCLRGLTYVEKLKLTNCRIREIEEFAFNDMESLRYLDLSHNLLTYLPEYLFEHNKNLERVSLSGNKFSAVPYIAVPLVKLDVSRCKISGLNFTKTLQVQHLDVSYNLLETLSSQDMQILNRVSTIKLNNNKWKCNSEFHEMMCWSLKKTNASMREIPIRCTSQKRRFSYTFDIRQKLCEEAVVDVSSLPSNSLDRMAYETSSPSWDRMAYETSLPSWDRMTYETSPPSWDGMAYETSLPSWNRMAHETSGNKIELTSHESRENSTNKVTVSPWTIIIIILALHIITTFTILAAVIYVVKKAMKKRNTVSSRDVSTSQSPLITENSEHTNEHTP